MFDEFVSFRRIFANWWRCFVFNLNHTGAIRQHVVRLSPCSYLRADAMCIVIKSGFWFFKRRFITWLSLMNNTGHAMKTANHQSKVIAADSTTSGLNLNHITIDRSIDRALFIGFENGISYIQLNSNEWISNCFSKVLRQSLALNQRR